MWLSYSLLNIKNICPVTKKKMKSKGTNVNVMGQKEEMEWPLMAERL